MRVSARMAMVGKDLAQLAQVAKVAQEAKVAKVHSSTTAVHEKEERKMLWVSIHSGRDLRVADLTSSDPYCMVWIETNGETAEEKNEEKNEEKMDTTNKKPPFYGLTKPTRQNPRQHQTNYIGSTLYPQWREDVYFPLDNELNKNQSNQSNQSNQFYHAVRLCRCRFITGREKETNAAGILQGRAHHQHHHPHHGHDQLDQKEEKKKEEKTHHCQKQAS